MATSQFTNKRITSISGDGKSVTALTTNFVGTFQNGIEQDIPAGAVDFELDLTVPGTPKLQLLVISANQNITIKTNSSTTPQETLTVSAGNGLDWGVGDSHAAPISAVVTKWFVSNPAATPCAFELRALFNEA